MEVICSIGPNVKSKEDLAVLAKAGMTSARFNFAHIKEENYAFIASLIKYLREEHPHIQVIQDIQGSKLRISSKYSKEFLATKGQEIYFCTESYYSAHRARADEFCMIPIACEGNKINFRDVTNIIMKDRTMEFNIINHGEDFQIIKAVVRRGGIIRAEKGVNAIGFDRSSLKLSLKDKKDINFGMENNVDSIYLSYVLSADNLMELKGYLKQARIYYKNKQLPKLWAKIESPEGVKNIKEILKRCHGIVLARGDLFAELDPLEVAYYERQIIDCVKRTTKPLVIATYVLDSMRNSLLPSLAEINEIYRYIETKIDGLMLVGEVSSGKYPKEAVEFLRNMIEKNG